MEENKNNAVEKAENAKRQKTAKRIKETKTPAKNSKKQKVKKATVKNVKMQQKKDRLNEKKEKRKKLKAEREQIKAEKRIETARIKAHKRAEKDKAKAAVLREKNRRKTELASKKEQIKAEKEAKKALLKNETKREKQKRIALEKAEKRRAKAEKAQEKTELKKQKLANKRAKREQKQNNKQKNKEQGRSFGGWLAAVISLGVASLILASALTCVILMPSDGDMMLNSVYSKSFYDTIEQVDNMDLNLSKALATKDSSAMQIYLTDTAVNSELAESNLQQLPLQDENKFYTTKLVNQIGDYAKYLNKKLARGESLSESDRAGLVQLYQANLTFKNALGRTMKEMKNDYNFSSMGNGNDFVISNFNELQNLSVEYPELIYDGPFSDGQDRKEVKGLGGNQITKEEAESIFKEIFGEYGLSEVDNVGESTGMIECYNVQAMVNGDLLYAQISKLDGKLIMFSYSGSCNSTEYNSDFIVEKADQFLLSLDMNGMKPVWINLSNNVYTINYAYTQNGIVIYPDLVKIRVCAETSMVIGMEASSYYTNHTERLISSPAVTETAAAKNVSDFIGIIDSRLVVVPIGSTTEKLCYEFIGEYDGSTYYVYIDAINGKQVEMFKVINSDNEGTLLM